MPRREAVLKQVLDMGAHFREFGDQSAKLAPPMPIVPKLSSQRATGREVDQAAGSMTLCRAARPSSAIGG